MEIESQESDDIEIYEFEGENFKLVAKQRIKKFPYSCLLDRYAEVMWSPLV